jgi:hypothetical protein
MTIDLEHARDFVYQHGVLWERALFGHLFEDRPLEAVQRALLAYKNNDNGFGNAMEHDARCPDSHPLALEFLLTVLTRTGIDPGNLLDGTAHWVEIKQAEDGSLCNPAAFLDYPHAPWWNGGGQTMPDSIVGNLMTLGKATPKLIASTRGWVERNVTLEAIHANDWLFMSYHAYDYFFADDDFPEVERYQEAVIANILRLAASAPENQRHTFFNFAPTPYLPVALAADEELLEACLQTLETTQQEDGGWRDQHGLPQWYPWVTICNLLTLRAYGRVMSKEY